MLWEKKAPAEADPASSASGSSLEKKAKKGKKKKYVKKVYYGSPLDQEAFQTERENQAAAAAQVTLLSELKAFLLTRKRLRLDPQKHIYFLYQPGKHVASAITIKNISKTHVAFKFQTNSPQSCYMRPNGGVLAPNESIIAIVTKYIENFDRVAQILISSGVDPETIAKSEERKTKEKRHAKEKFKIISVPVQADADYYPDMFEDDEDNVYVERILQVVFLDPNKASSEQLNKLQNRLAEAEGAEAARKKESEAEGAEEEPVPGVVAPIPEGQGGVINEWKQRREAFLAQQQAGGGKPS